MSTTSQTVRRLAKRSVAALAGSGSGQRVLQFCSDRELVPPSRLPRTDVLSLVATAPTEMSQEERGFLYALVRGCQPRRVLEIGTSEGGSALVMATAMEANGGEGRIWTIDPMPRIAFDPALFRGRVESVVGASPGAVTEVAGRAGGPFDLAVIDGIHIHKQAAADLAAVRPHLADGAFVLMHDAFHFGVSEAARELVESDPEVHDVGYPCNRPRRVGERVTHAGFRMLRIGARSVDVAPLVAPTWAEVGLEPPLSPDLVDHDFWYCWAIEPCAYCQEHGLDPLSPPPQDATQPG
ncbi:MAG TPA: CmcI family methyltransferase [Mycobacteriales bacterium]